MRFSVQGSGWYVLNQTFAAARLETWVERARARETNRPALERGYTMKSGSITICLIVSQVIVQDETLDALLFGALGFLLASHGNGEIGIRG